MLKAKLVKAREARGWSIFGAAKKTLTVHPYALRKLESGETDPSKASASTMIDLLNLYYPELALSDFVGAKVAGMLVAQMKRPRGRPRKDTR
jgi:ribosome-binding protein aMBF1 (putative translation factor)